MIRIAAHALAPFGVAALLLPLTPSDASAPSAPAQPVTLCGWVQNPTPGNWWIVDSIGDWTMATQGNEGAEGMDLIPDMTRKQWVRTNGYYGYGCGCMSATVDRKDRRILRIHSFKQKPLAACRADRKLPRPDE